MKVYSPKKRYVEMKNRPCYGLSLCMDEGRITYTQNGIDYVEDRLHAVILPQGQSYTLCGNISGYFPVINFSTLQPMTDTVAVLEVRNSAFLIKCYEELQKIHSLGGNRNKMFSLLYEMLGELSLERIPTVIDPAVGFIYDNYSSQDISNAILAAKCNISEVYFRKLFKSRFGISPKQYVLSLRLQKAKLLLSEGRMNICSIANAYGFDSSAPFCRMFKQQIGISPSEYRGKNEICEI
jgi:AraC-like DNA-binding protein